MTAQLQADIDRLVAAVFGGHTTDATVLAAALLDTADSAMGEEVDSGIFVTDESVQAAMDILRDTAGEEAGLGRPMRDRLVHFLYEDPVDQPAWQILQLSSSDGRSIFVAQRVEGYSLLEIDRQLLGVFSTAAEARAIIDQHCYADAESFLSRGGQGIE